VAEWAVLVSDIDEIIARCKVIAGEAKADAARIERRRWKPLTAAQEPRVAPNWAKGKYENKPLDEER
jgi:hypothetical protein